MPINTNLRSYYGAEWAELANGIKERVGWKCELCGKQCRKPADGFDTHKNTLTVAHLDHNPQNNKADNLMALCAPCHCRYDGRTKGEAKKGLPKTVNIQRDLDRVRRQNYVDKHFEQCGMPLDG